MADRQGLDTLIPELRLRINGQAFPVDAKADLISLTVLEDVNATSMFTFTVLCWDGMAMRVKWIDDDIFKEGNGVEIDMGYGDRQETLFKGEITGLEPDFPYGQPPTLTVRGYDRRHRLMRKRKTRTFLNMKDSDIATQVAGDWGLTPDTEDSRVTLEYVLQHNQTDFEFLLERAQRIGYEMVVTNTTLRFRARQNQGSAAVTLRREVELIDFNARLTTVGQVEEVAVRGWNPKNKEEIIAQARVGDERRMGGSASGPVTTRQAFSGTGGVIVKLPVLSRDEADQLANGWFGEMALGYVEAQGVCIGQPDLRAGKLVQIEGLGRRFSGAYYVISTEHSYKPRVGYRTAFTVRRNAT
ncbi:MAG TPA: contractile injection system protein, VgrG/Pvc8 family [Candidatus Binatia bacterium]|nr:contractile injection system protein, VgrG/Pvc8 family [Candidatus Binatia bacterium]